MEKLEYWKKHPTGAPFDTMLSDEEIRKQIPAIQEKVRQFYDNAATHPADDAVSESQRDVVWAFLASERKLSLRILAEAVTLSVEDSLARSPQAASLVPPEVAERIRGRHALVASYEGHTYANTPERMLAPPTDVQGEWAGTHLLLLELSSQLGRNFGEGACQLYIKPDDLKARRFDQVKQCFEAY